MSYVDYVWARAQLVSRWPETDAAKMVQAVTRGDPPFHGVIMLAMMCADTFNTAKLRAAWPDTWEECQARYNAPGALLADDPPGLRAKVET